MELTILNDIHYGGKNEHKAGAQYLDKIIDEWKYDYKKPSDNIILAGDIVELKNVLKKNIESQARVLADLLKIFDDNYLHGNHELSTRFNYVIKKSTFIEHGDLALWGSEKALKYRQKNPGCSWIKYYLGVPLFEWARHLKPFKLKKDQKERIYGATKAHSCNRYICGHTHIKNKKTIKYKDIEIILLPRGINRVVI